MCWWMEELIGYLGGGKSGPSERSNGRDIDKLALLCYNCSRD